MGRPRLPGAPDTAPCPRCGKVFSLTSYQRAALRRKGQTPYCSQACWLRTHNNPERNAALARATAEQRGNTLRGRGEGRGYRKRGGRHEHRVVMEEALGRTLLPGEIVHHLNHLRLPNTSENLGLTNRADHARHHFWGKPLSSIDLTNVSASGILSTSQQEQRNDATSSGPCR